METNIDNLEYLILSVDRFLLKNNERVIEVEIDRGVNVLKTSSIEKWRQQNKNAGLVKDNIGIKNIVLGIFKKRKSNKEIIEYMDTG